MQRGLIRRWRFGAAGLAGTLLLHALLLGSLVAGAGAHKTRRPDQYGDGANALGSHEPAGATLVMINVPPPSEEEVKAQEVTSAGVKPPDHGVLIASLATLPPPPVASVDDAIARSVDSPSAEDAASRALLVGRYQGQIKARIERVWSRPRDPVAGDEFRCTVKILQDARGNVTEIDLVSCSDATRWQASLAKAISSASPLPAPPDPTVYSDAVTLVFSSPA